MANGTDDENENVNSSSNSTKTGYKLETCAVSEVPSHVILVEGCPTSHFVEIQQENYHAPQLTTVPKFSLPKKGNGLNVSRQKGFSIKTLRDCLESCLEGADGGIDLDNYLDAYREICKLLDNLETIVKGRIVKDIKEKIALMRDHRMGPNGAFYDEIGKMVTFEKIKNIPQTNPFENGSRTILILHRSLKFVVEFLRSLNDLKPDQDVGIMGGKVYNLTLARYHTWGSKHIARMAFLTLGKKRQLVANFHDGSLTPAQLRDLIECVVNVASRVFLRCQAIYEQNNFLDLS